MEEGDECVAAAAKLFAAYGGSPWKQQLQRWAETSPEEIAVRILNDQVSRKGLGLGVYDLKFSIDTLWFIVFS